jgi:hypothetical protein
MTDDPYEDLSDTDVPKDFSVISWFRSIPLCDDVWLGMQAQHIAAVEIGIIRPLELHTARKLFNEEGAGDLMMALNGVSQMWLFALYEFRTWRQRAKHLLKLAEQYSKTKPAKQKAFLEKSLADAKGKEKHIYSGFSFYSEHISRIADVDFVASIKAYHDRTDGYFDWIEGLRMNLAKHEVQGKKRGMVAEAPGYARIDMVRGTLYWQFIGTDGGLEKLDRREAANLFLGIEVPDYRE